MKRSRSLLPFTGGYANEELPTEEHTYAPRLTAAAAIALRSALRVRLSALMCARAYAHCVRT